MDLGGFIVARGVTHASQGEGKAIPQLHEKLPMHPVSLTTDTGYSAGELRQLLEDRGIKAYIPLRPIQENNVEGPGDFSYQDDRLVCPQGKELHGRGFNEKEQRYTYTARREDCQASDPERLPTAPIAAQVRVSNPVLPDGPVGQGKEPDQRISPREDQTPGHRGRNLRFPGPPGMGQNTAEGALESRLRRVHGALRPQCTEDGASARPWCGAARSSGARRCHHLLRRTCHGRWNRECRDHTALFDLAPLVGPLPRLALR